jgi:hypothetical protein
MDLVSTIALSLGSAWSSGINVYATVFVLGLMGSMGGVDLPPSLDILTNPFIIGLAGFMYVVEFFADKIPGVDSVWDVLQTFVRIPAGAILAAQSLGPVDPVLALGAGLVGGSLATATHATKSGSRLMINTSPEPFSNWMASLTEDFLAIAAVWTALQHPWIFLGLLIIAIFLMVKFIPVLWRGLMKIKNSILGLFTRRPGTI